MARFSVLGDEDEAEEGPGSSSSRPRPKRQKVSIITQTPPPQPSPSPQQTPPAYVFVETEELDGEEEEEEEEELEVGIEAEEEEEEEEESEFEGEEDDEEDDQDEEELENQQQPDSNEEPTKDGSISVTFTDPDVLDCPICLESLSIPVFQCENGHIACSSCCLKIRNKCPSCSWPIGYNRCRAIEKVLESVQVSCRNQKYGCKQKIKYSNKHDHEDACVFSPCSCPLLDCNFIGASWVLYSHFSSRHPTSTKSFIFNKKFSVSLERNQRYIILLEDNQSSIFVLNHFSDLHGSAISIVQIASFQSWGLFYDIIASSEETSITLHSSVESIRKWVDSPPAKKFVIVPSYCTTTSGQLKLGVCIGKQQEPLVE